MCHLFFVLKTELKVTRKEEFGGDRLYTCFEDVQQDYANEVSW